LKPTALPVSVRRVGVTDCAPESTLAVMSSCDTWMNDGPADREMSNFEFTGTNHSA
jgi:hypothetical protein